MYTAKNVSFEINTNTVQVMIPRKITWHFDFNWNVFDNGIGLNVKQDID